MTKLSFAQTRCVCRENHYSWWGAGSFKQFQWLALNVLSSSVRWEVFVWTCMRRHVYPPNLLKTSFVSWTHARNLSRSHNARCLFEMHSLWKHFKSWKNECLLCVILYCGTLNADFRPICDGLRRTWNECLCVRLTSISPVCVCVRPVYRDQGSTANSNTRPSSEWTHSQRYCFDTTHTSLRLYNKRIIDLFNCLTLLFTPFNLSGFNYFLCSQWININHDLLSLCLFLSSSPVSVCLYLSVCPPVVMS